MSFEKYWGILNGPMEIHLRITICFLYLWYSMIFVNPMETRASLKELLPPDWSVSMSVSMFLISGWCGHSSPWEVPPWIGEPELLKKVSRACCGKQVSKQCSYMASVSVSAFRWLPWFPLMINYNRKLKYSPNCLAQRFIIATGNSVGQKENTRL